MHIGIVVFLVWCVPGSFQARTGVSSCIIPYQSRVVLDGVISFGIGDSRIQLIPKSVKPLNPPFRPSRVRMSDLRSGGDGVVIITDNTAAGFPVGTKTNEPELSVRAVGEGINAIRVETSMDRYGPTCSTIAAIQLQDESKPMDRPSNDKFTESPILSVLDTLFGTPQNPATVAVSSIPDKNYRIQRPNYLSITRPVRGKLFNSRQPVPSMDTTIRKAYTTDESHIPLDPMTYAGTPGSTGARPSYPPGYNNSGGTGTRPPMWTSERVEMGKGAGMDVASSMGFQPTVNTETGRLMDRSTTIFVSSEIITLLSIEDGPPRAVDSNTLLESLTDPNAILLLTDIPDGLDAIKSLPVYEFNVQLKAISIAKHHILSTRYKQIAVFENIVVYQSRGPAYQYDVMTITTMIVKNVYLGGILTIPIEGTSAVAVLGAHGIRNGWSGRMIHCKDDSCAEYVYDETWDPTHTASLSYCNPSVVGIGYYCYDWWDGVYSSMVKAQGTGSQWCGWGGSGCVKEEYYMIEQRGSSQLLDEWMTIRPEDRCGDITGLCTVTALQAPNRFCNPICGHNMHGESVDCTFCFQTQRQCSPPMPFHVHVSSGCFNNLAGNWICSDSCQQDCDPSYYHMLCQSYTFGDYDDYTYTVADYNASILERTLAYWQSVGAGAGAIVGRPTVLQPLTAADLEQDCQKVYLQNFGGKCCLKCPIGYYNPSCVGHRVVTKPNSNSFQTHFIMGNPGTCKRCTTKPPQHRYRKTAYCTAFQDTGYSTTTCANGFYTSKTCDTTNPNDMCNGDEYHTCIPCPLCPVDTKNVGGVCGGDRNDQVCEHCPRPYPSLDRHESYRGGPMCSFTCVAPYIKTLANDKRYACCTPCVNGVNFEYYACTASQDRICRPCNTCGPGEYISRPCTSTLPNDCRPCPPGTFADINHVCQLCPCSTFQPNYGQTSCTSCPPRSVSRQGEGDSCMLMPDGAARSLDECMYAYCPWQTYAAFSGPSVTRIDQLRCTECNGWKRIPTGYSQGTYAGWRGVPATSITQCTCGLGTREWDGRCLMCEDGTHNPGTGCMVCPKGKFSPPIPPLLRERELIISPPVASEWKDIPPPRFQCVDCFPGTYNPIEGGNTVSACLSCPGGWWCSGTEQPIQCSSGTYCPPGSIAPISCAGTSFAEKCGGIGLSAPMVFTRCQYGWYNFEAFSCLRCSGIGYGAYYIPSDLSRGNCPSVRPGESYSRCAFGYDVYQREIPCPLGCICNYDFKLHNELSVEVQEILMHTVQCGRELFGTDVCRLCEAGKYEYSSFHSSCYACTPGKYSIELGRFGDCILRTPPGTFSGWGYTVPRDCFAGTYSTMWAASACYMCDPGTYQDSPRSTNCIPCESGSFSSEFGSVYCRGCPPNSVTPMIGASQCVTCDNGKFSVDVDTSQCYNCTAGSFHLTGEENCTDCSPGSYSSSTNSTDCTLCPVGTNTSSWASTSCVMCPSGKYAQDPMSEVCTECYTGKYASQNGASTCDVCGPGTYALSSNRARCESCPLGKSTSTYETLKCLDCAYGKYADNVGSVLCKPCETLMSSAFISYSSHQSMMGASYCDMCTPGTYAIMQGTIVCMSCPYGKYNWYWGANRCHDCPINSVSISFGASTCSECPAGTISPSAGLVRCSDCSRGTYKALARYTDCIPCSSGTYSREYASTVCTICQGNTFTSSIGASSCLDCPGGSWVSTRSDPIFSWMKNPYSVTCVSCVPGKYRMFQAAGNCQLCATGMAQPAAGSTGCTLCGAGYFSYQAGSVNCIGCPVGWYSESIVNTACKACYAGTYQANPGQSVCIHCTPGYVNSQPGRSTCTACQPGLYFLDTMGTACSQCYRGTYQSVSGKSGCNLCIPGFFSDRVQQTVCIQCSAGYYSSSYMSSSCDQCDFGTFQALVGASVCASCEPGTYGELRGATACANCIPGSYTAYSGYETCVPCVLGQYQDDAGATFCKLCPVGTFNRDYVRTQCTACLVGTYSAYTGAFDCTGCQLGTYQSIVGSTHCNTCRDGTYAFSDSQSSCECPTCPSGYYGVFRVEFNDYTCVTCPLGYFCLPCEIPTACPIGTFHQLLTGIATGTEFCVGCRPGSYGSSSGQTHCEYCLPGEYSTVIGAVSLSLCKECDLGYYSTGYGSDACMKCQDCSGATHYRQFECRGANWTYCVPCTIPYGTYYLPIYRNGLKNDCYYQNCTICPVGKYYSQVCNMTFQDAVCETCTTFIDPDNVLHDSVPVGYYQLPHVITYIPNEYVWAVSSQAGQQCRITQCSNCSHLGKHMNATCDAIGTVTCQPCSKPALTYWSTDGLDYQTACNYQTCTPFDGLGIELISECSDYEDTKWSQCAPKLRYSEWVYDPSEPVGLRYCNYKDCEQIPGIYYNGWGCFQYANCTDCNHTGLYYVSECEYVKNDAVCGQCTNKPDQTVYTGPGSPLTANKCPHEASCIRGYYNLKGVCTRCSHFPGFVCHYGPAWDNIIAGIVVGTCGINDTAENTSCSCYNGYYSNSRYECLPCRPSGYCGDYGTLTGVCEPNGTSDLTYCECKNGFYRPSPLVCLPCVSVEYCLALSKELAYCLGNRIASCFEAGEMLGQCKTNDTVDTSNCICNPGIARRRGLCLLLCQPGEYKTTFSSRNNTNDESCSPCPAGTYIGKYQSTVCTSCDVGKYHVLSGQTSSKACQACGVGMYMQLSNPPMCVSCPKHTYNPMTGELNCSMCPNGTYTSTLGVSSLDGCVGCGAGTYMENITSRECKQCIAGTYETGVGFYGQSFKCLYCEMGKYFTGTGSTTINDCQVCPVGSRGTQPVIGEPNACTLCPAGKFGRDGYYRDNFYILKLYVRNVCYDCDRGFYQSMTGAYECLECEYGKFADYTGATWCDTCSEGRVQYTYRESCLCPPNYFGTPPNGPCYPCRVPDAQACVSGSASFLGCSGASRTDMSKCICTRGWYNDASGICLACPPGKYQPTPGNQITDSRCIECGVGTYQPLFNASGIEFCLPCPVGTFSSNTNVPTEYDCETCGTGRYQTGTGMISSVSCVACGKGMYQPVNDAKSAQQCLLCPPGTYASNGGLTDISGCSKCGLGTFQTGYGAILNVSCVPCQVGTYQPTLGGTGNMSCVPCQAGSAGTGIGFQVASQCTKCGEGTYGSVVGSTSLSECILCPNGTYGIGTGVVECTHCKPGTFQTGVGMQNQSDCMSCASGTFSVNLSPYECSGCTAGTYNSKIGSSVCNDCSAGTIAELDNATFCELCQLGTYLDTSAGTTCLACPIGKVSSGRGSVVCADCGAGTYSGGMGSSVCDVCPPGTYYGGVGASLCQTCTVGWYSSGYGYTICDTCMVGSFANVSGASVCDMCSPGQYQNRLGSTSCVLCYIGLYSGTAGSPLCESCRVGTFQSVTGMSFCDMCNPGTYQTVIGEDTRCASCDIGKYITSTGTYWNNKVGDGVVLAEGTYLGSNLSLAYEANTVIFLSFARVSMANDRKVRFIVYECEDVTCVNPVVKYTFMGGTSISAGSMLQINTGVMLVSLSVKVACVGDFAKCAPAYYAICGDKMLDCFIDVHWMANLTGFCTSCTPGTYGVSVKTSNCAMCAPGYYQPDFGATDCVECNTGTYSPGVGASMCVKCPPGKFKQSSSAYNCSECGYGTYVNTSGASVCQDCNLGTYSDSLEASVCRECSPGTMNDIYMQSTCYPCTVGTFTRLWGSTACSECEPGSYGNSTGLTGCEYCPPGTYQGLYHTTACFQCNQGTYSTGINITDGCTQCPYNHLNTVGASSYEQVCLACFPGTFIAEMGCENCTFGTFSSEDGADNCTACPIGTYRDEMGGWSIDQCVLCPAGSFGIGAGMSSCELCPAKTFSAVPNSSICILCPPGEYGYLSGQSECLQCSKGLYSSSFGSYYDECYQCSVGFYNSKEGSSVCLQCDVGTFAEMLGSLSCLGCEIGTYQNTTHQSVCITCPPGAFSANSSSTCCEQCPVATYQDRDRATECLICPSGAYMSMTGWSVSGCTACEAGQYSTMVGASTLMVCTECHSGYASGVLGLNSSDGCDMCPHGTVSLPNRSQCVACVDSTYCPSGYETPIQCVPGLVCNGSSIGAPPGFLFVLAGNCTLIMPCPNGTHCSLMQDKAIFSGPFDNWFDLPVFVLKLNGSFQVDTSCNTSFGYGSERIDRWEDVWTQHDVLFWLAPLVCSQGYFLEGDVCMSCPFGHYSSLAVAYSNETCRECPIGTYQNRTGAYGVLACLPCEPGTFSNVTGVAECSPCALGFHQQLPGQLDCQECPVAQFAETWGRPECEECPRDTFQNETGISHCWACSANEFSSVGDVGCTSCLSNGEPPNPWCETPRMPVDTSSIWLSVRGAQDECLGQGVSYFEDDETLVKTIYTNATVATCYHSLRVLGRPDLARDWPVTVKDMRRPATVEVISFNTTFYPVLCQSQGFGVLFVARDNRSESMIDASDMTANMQLRDFDSGGLLYQVTCSHIPVLSEDVIYGTCKTSNYCPTQKVQVIVVLTWPAGSAQGVVVMTPAAVVIPKSTLSWVMSFQVLTPGIPYFAGDTVKIQVNSLNTYGTIAVFRFAVTMGSNVIFRRFTSVYTVVSGVQDGTLSVVGQASSDVGNVLGLIELTVLTATQGVNEIASVLGSFCEITLSDSVSHSMSSRLSMGGYLSDPARPVIFLLMDVPRYTRLIARPRKTMLIQWQAVSASAVMFPTQIKVLGVMNIMDRYAYVSASCASLSGFLLVTSCDNIKATGAGSGSSFAGVRVTFGGMSVTVGFAVFVPRPMQTVLFPRSLAVKGHYKLLSDFYAGDLVIPNVDVTPYVDPMTLRVSINEQVWSCIGENTFTIGSASGVCGTLGVRNASSVFVWNEGVTGLGQYLLIPSRVTPASPHGALMVFDDAGDLLTPVLVTSGDTRRLLVSVLNVALVKLGESSRCVGIVVDGNSHFLLPVWSAPPTTLQVEFSSGMLLSRLDSSGLIPYSASVKRVSMLFDGHATGIDILSTPPRVFALSNDTLDVQGLTVSTTNAYGKFLVGVMLLENSCIAGSYLFNVVRRAAGDPVLDCGLVPTMTLPDDPMSLMFPSLFPSGFALSRCLLRYSLVDGTVKTVEASVQVGGTCNVSVTNGVMSPMSDGTIEIRDSRAANVVLVQVVSRMAVSMRLICNGVACPSLKLTVPGNGAILPPFSYASQLTVTLKVGLTDGSWKDLTVHALGVDVHASGVSLMSSSVPLTFGTILLEVMLEATWQLSKFSESVTVIGITDVTASGPSVIRQIHDSGIWEEAVIVVTGQLSDGVSKNVAASFTSSTPLVQHANGRFHLDYFAENVSVLVSFGGRETLVWMAASEDSVCISDVDVLFLPVEWTNVANTMISLLPALTPRLAIPWTSSWNLSSRVVTWTSAQPSVLAITPAQASAAPKIQLLDDYYEAVSVIAELRGCGPGISAVTKTAHITPNIVPNVDGQLDFGAETGLMVQATDVNSVVSVGVYAYASMALQTFTLEVTWPNQAMDVESCTPSDIRDSQCVLLRADDNSMYVRSVGSYVSSILSGRVRLATLEVHVKLQALVEISLNVPQLVANGRVWRNIGKTYRVMLGGMHVGRRLLSAGGLHASRRLLEIPQGSPQVWGDADGDGECTSLDVQFLQLYLMNQAFTGDQQICVAACQWRSTLTAWQLSQLNPVRDPLGPAVPPDGSSVLFYLRALVRKTHFLSDWRVNITTGEFNMFVEFTDYTGRRVPASTLVKIALNTQLNANLGFISGTVTVDTWLQVETVSDPGLGGYSVTTVPNAVIRAEYLVPVKILIETFDIRGQPALDRQFTFFTGRPFTFVSLLSSNASDEQPVVIPLVPIRNCTDLCDDVLYFDDFFTGIPSWLGNILHVRYDIRAPSMQTQWFTVDLRVSPLVATNLTTTRNIMIMPLCHEVILWSYLGGIDETCIVNVTDESLATEQYTCSRYPCWITYANQTYQVAIPTLFPYRPQVILQQNVIREFGRTPWIATVSLWGEQANYVDVAVTKSVWSKGLVYAYPATSVSISPRWIRGLRVGMCAIYFGRMAASVNVTLEPQEVVLIEAFAFKGAQINLQTENTADILWNPPQFPAGSVGYIIVRVLFVGGFTIRLEASDDLRIDSLHSSINLRPDGSFDVHIDTGYFQGNLFAVHWNGWTTTVNGSLLPYAPSAVRACCPQYVTYPSSPATGLGDYKSRFTLEEIVVSFGAHPSERVLLTDPRISLEFNTNILAYDKGFWTVLDEPGIPLGPTIILVKYTHPVSLVYVTTETYVIIVDARDLLVSIEYDPGTLSNQLWRLHCSDKFQSAYITAHVDLEIDQVDVTGRLQVLSSNPKAIRVRGNELRGIGPGVSEILVFYRGFTKSMQIEVVDVSLPLVSLYYGATDAPVVLQGQRFSTYPAEIGGVFLGQDGTESFWVWNVTFVSPMIETSPELMLQPGYLLQALANTYDPIEEHGGYIIASVAACDGFKPDDLVVDITVNLNMSNTNETGLDIGSQLAEAMIQHGSTEIPLWIHVGTGVVSAYYIELHTDLKVQECMRGNGTTGFFECTLFDPTGVVRLAGTGLVGSTGMHLIATLLVLPSWGNESICGHLEVFSDIGVATYNISTGLLGPACGPPPEDANPIVDTSVIWRDYQCVLGITSPCSSTNVTAWYRMLLLVHKQRHVIPVVYSNDLELSVMVQVLDRFGRPDTSQVRVNITLFTDKLPIARGLGRSTQVGLSMNISNIEHHKDGWYMVQWRQKIPVINLTVLFEVATVDDTGTTSTSDRQWIMPPLVVNLTTGRALPNCPHSVYEPGFLQSSYVLYVSNATNLTFAESSSMQKQIACAIDSTGRRVQITALDDTRISVTVTMESFMRLHEMNSYLLDLEFMKTVMQGYNRTLLKVERGLSRYLSSPADSLFVCPVGHFINQTADLETLPQHADAGPDCYGFVCRPDYEQYGPDCIPKTTDDRVFWSSILMVLTLILAIIVTSCLMRVSTWGLEAKPALPGPAMIQAEPQKEPGPPLNMLPVDVVEIDGTMSLVFEEDGDSSSSSSDPDE